MKVCPSCRTTFDDSQNFCLNDGTPLIVAETEMETIVAPPEPVEHRSYQTIPPAAHAPIGAPRAAPAKKSNTGLIAAATALGVLLLVGLGAGAWWTMSRKDNNANNRNQPVARTNANTNTISNSNLNSNVAARSSTPAVVTSTVNGSVPATNSAVVAPSETDDVAEDSPPTSAPPVSAREAATVRKEVSGAVSSWANAIESGNINGHLNYYADTLEYYYTARGFSKNQVRADKQRAFEAFDDIEFNISNVRVTPEADGDRATVVYDKAWAFSNAERTSEGKVQSQMTLQKIGGRWLIVGERDLKVY
jgi:ketosteroid isomerase-like protein